MTHHEELGNEHRELLKQLELAKQFKEKKRKLHKANRASDMARFEFQNAIGLVNQLEKKLWKFYHLQLDNVIKFVSNGICVFSISIAYNQSINY